MRSPARPGPLDPSVDPAGFVRYRYHILAALRAEAPAVHVPELGLWAVTRYDAVRTVLTDPDRFPSGGAFGGSTGLARAAELIYDLNGPIFRYGLINTDRPLQARLRAPLVSAFSAHRIRALTRVIAEDAEQLLDQFGEELAARSSVDLRAQVTAPLPLGTLCRLFGIPRDEGPAISHEAQAISVLPAPGLPEALQVDAATRLAAYDARLRTLLSDPAARASLDDGLIRDICDARQRGENDLSDDELVGNLGGLIFAGHETTVNTLTNALGRVLADRELWTAVSHGDVDTERLVEELLRLDTSVIGLFRITREPQNLNGVDIPAGAVLWPSFAAANRDPAQFPDPDRLDLTRPPGQRHLTFGHGLHHCMGSLLARTQITTIMTTLPRRFPNLVLGADPDETDTASIIDRGPQRLLVAQS